MYGHLYGPLNRPRRITVAAQRIPCGSHLITIVVGTPNHKDPIGSRWIPHGSRRFSIVFRILLRMHPERILSDPVGSRADPVGLFVLLHAVLRGSRSDPIGSRHFSFVYRTLLCMEPERIPRACQRFPLFFVRFSKRIPRGSCRILHGSCVFFDESPTEFKHF